MNFEAKGSDDVVFIHRCLAGSAAGPRRGDAAQRSGPEGGTAEQVVQRQLEAYNAHDIEAFVATYSDDVEIVRHPGKVDIKGKAALRAQYAPLFQRVKPTARIPHRTAMGNRIADVEAITINGTEYCCALAVYEIGDGLIRRVDLIASDDFMKPKKP